jgi:hypothetical protein
MRYVEKEYVDDLISKGYFSIEMTREEYEEVLNKFQEEMVLYRHV